MFVGLPYSAAFFKCLLCLMNTSFEKYCPQPSFVWSHEKLIVAEQSLDCSRVSGTHRSAYFNWMQAEETCLQRIIV